MGSLVYRDFEPLIANFGDVVNTSRPADFKGKRKTDADNVVTQNAVSPNIRVPLDQHLHVSFVIKDGEYSKALPDLLERYMEPAARELAEKVDQVLTGQAARLAVNAVGRMTEITELNADTFVLDADQFLNDNRAPKSGRYLVLSSRANRACLGAELFVSAEKRGDEGSALREASLGRVYGFDGFMDQNVNNVRADLDDSETAAITGAHPVGYAGTIPTSLTTTTTIVGSYVRIPGHTRVYRTTVVTDNSGDATITLDAPLEKAVSAAAVIVGTRVGAVDVAVSYLLGHVQDITVDGHASGRGPQVGQTVTFGVGGASHIYNIIDVTVTSATVSQIMLDRPLEAVVADNAVVYYGVAGNKNLAFTRDSIALVTRPLSLPPDGSGARAAVTSFDGLSMRVVMTYDGVAQGTRVTFDLLCGVAILDTRQAVVVYG